MTTKKRKNKMADKLKREDSFGEFYDELVNKNACAQALDKYQNQTEKTIGEVIDGFLSDEQIDQSWASWVLSVMWSGLDEKVRKTFIKKVKDPMMAFKAYLKIPDLTASEDALLEAKFKNKLPKAEKELKDGIVVRAKNG